MTDSLPQIKAKSVSLSGKTRLTFREAVALLDAANRGEAEIELEAQGDDDKILLRPLSAAIQKLKQSISTSHGYDGEGHLRDPFKRRRV